MQRAEAIHYLTEHRKELLDQYRVAFFGQFSVLQRAMKQLKPATLICCLNLGSVQDQSI